MNEHGGGGVGLVVRFAQLKFVLLESLTSFMSLTSFISLKSFMSLTGQLLAFKRGKLNSLSQTQSRAVYDLISAFLDI